MPLEPLETSTPPRLAGDGVSAALTERRQRAGDAVKSIALDCVCTVDRAVPANDPKTRPLPFGRAGRRAGCEP
jgi:hypothetical protein